jgi:hypothetical protein
MSLQSILHNRRYGSVDEEITRRIKIENGKF